MAWARFDDRFDDDPDIDRMSGDAVALFVCSITWSSRSLSDGFIPEVRVPKLFCGTAEAVEMLCSGDKPWWLKEEGGYRIRNFFKYNPTAEQVRKDREQRAEAGRKGGRKRRQTESEMPSEPLSDSLSEMPTPYPVSRSPYSRDHKYRNSLEFQREPMEGKDYVLRCSGDDPSAKMLKLGTDELFDAAEWFASRNLTPTRRWEGLV